MPSIDIEFDEYQLERAVASGIEDSGLEQAITDAVSGGFEEANFIEALHAIRERLDVLDEKIHKPGAPGKGPDYNGGLNYYGYRPGEEVILFNKINPNGLRGVVDPDAWDASSWSNVLPVRRKDTGEGDGFPVQQTILAGPLDEFLASRVGAVVEEARAEIERQPEAPSGDPIAWNLNRFEEAIDQQTGMEFVYRTPAPSYLNNSQDSEKLRRFRPAIIDRIGPEDRQSIIRGYDVDAKDLRAFRIDRIKGYVEPSSDI